MHSDSVKVASLVSEKFTTMERRKRKVLSSEEALRDIEQFIDDDRSDDDNNDDDDLCELLDEDEFVKHMRARLEETGGDAVSAEIGGKDGEEMEKQNKVCGESVEITAAVGFEIVERTPAESVQQKKQVGQPKRKLTKYKLVNSLDAALNEEN